MSAFRKLVHDCLTENDGKSYCPIRVLGMLYGVGVFPVFAGGVVFIIWHTHQFPMLEFAGAFSTIVSSFGILAAGIRFKAKTDTPAPDGGTA